MSTSEDGRDDRGFFRKLATAIERAAAEEAASSAVRGAVDGLEDLPRKDGQVGEIVRDALTVVGRLAREAAEREGREPGDAVRTMASAATAGALQQLEKEWENGGMPLHDFLMRVNQLLDELIAFARSRDAEIRSPGERAHSMAASAIRGATEEIHEALPVITGDLRGLAPVGSEIAREVGRGLLDGVRTQAKADPEALSSLLDRAGRALVGGIVGGLEYELKARGIRPDALPHLVEQTAAASVRGIAAGVREAFAPLRRALDRMGGLRVLAGAGGAALLGGLILAARR